MKRPSAKGNSAVWRLGLILLLSVALWPLSPRAEAPIGRFVIGVWSPAGWSGAELPDTQGQVVTATATGEGAESDFGTLRW